MTDWMDDYGGSAPSTGTVVDAPPPQPVPAPAPASTTGDWMDGFRPSASNADLSLKIGQQIPPDKAAQVLKLQDQTGLPTQTISDNLEDVKQRQAQQSLSPEFIQDHPKLSDWLGQDPHHAAVANDDIPALGYVERQLNYLSNSSMRSVLELERTFYGLKGIASGASPDNTDRVNQIDKQLETNFAPPAGASPTTRVFGKAAELTPEYGAPLALGAMGGVAGSVAMATAFGSMEAANSYLDFKKKVDNSGKPINDDLARGASLVSGAITFALSFVPGLGKEAEETPGLKMLQREGMSGILQSPTLLSSVEKLLKNVGMSSIAMGTFAGGSAFGHIASQELAKLQNDGSLESMSPGAILGTIFTPQNIKQVSRMALGGAVVGGAIEGVTGSWGVWNQYSKSNEALNTRTAWNNVSNAKKNMTMYDIAPDQLEKVTDRLAGDGHVYIPLDKWQEWAEKQKVDPRDAWQQATGSTQKYDEALKTGSDLQMSSSHYASRIAGSDHNDFFSNVLRSNPQAMNAEEAEGFLGKQTPAEEAKRNAVYNIHEAVAPTPKPEPPAEPGTTAMTVPEPLPTPETEPITPAPTTPEGKEASQHIQAAMQDLGHKPLDLEGMGMTEAQKASVNEAQEKVHATAQEEMTRAIVDKQLKQKSKAWNDERDLVEEDVNKDSYAHKEFLAQEILRKPIETKEASEALRQQALARYNADKYKWDIVKEVIGEGIGRPKTIGGQTDTLDEWKQYPSWAKKASSKLGSDEVAEELRERGVLGENEDFHKFIRELKAPKRPSSAEDYIPEILQQLGPIKLKRDIVEKEFPEADLSKMKGMFSDIVGVHPDEAALRLGFSSGSRLIYDLNTTPKREDWVQQETDRRMADRHPEVMSETNLPEAAIRAVNNEHRGKLLRKQLEHYLTEEFSNAKFLMSKIAGRIPSTKELKEDVDRDISVKTYRELSPSLYLQAMKYAQDDAEHHLKAGEFARLIDAKKAELRSLEMYRAAQKALDMINKRVEKTRDYNSASFQQMLGRAGGMFRDNVNELLSRIDLKNITYKEIQARSVARGDLQGLVEEMAEKGTPVEFSQKALDKNFRQNYKEVKYGDLMNYLDDIDNIVSLAREQEKLFAMEKFQKVSDYRDAIIAQIGKDFNLTGKELGFPKPSLTNESSLVKQTQAHLTRMEFLFDHYDMWKPNGVVKQGFSDAMSMARGHEGDLIQRHLFELPDVNLNDLVEKIPGRSLWYAKLHYIPEIDMSLFKPNMIRIARYRQNDYAWDALLKSYGWTDAQGMAVISKLSKEELDLVDGLSKNFEALKKESFDKYKQFHGIAPEAVQASPWSVTLADGTVRKMDGGYSSVTFNNTLSKGAKAVEDVFGDQWGPARPSDAHLQARIGTGGKAVSLDLNDEIGVLGQMIHWVSFADPISNANKIIGDKAISAHMIAALGKESFDEIPKWLKDIAGNNPLKATPIDRVYTMVKSASMIANLGLKTTSELKHLFNYGSTVNELGPHYAAKGIQTFLGNPMKIAERWNQILALDPYMRQWAANWDKDLSQAAKRLNIAGEPSVFGATTLFGRAMSVKDALTHDFTRMLFSIYGYAYMGIGGSAWEGAYIKAMDGAVDGIKAGDEKSAIQYAGRVVRTTIAAGNTEDIPSIMRGKGMEKLFTWFYGPMNLMANNSQKHWQQFGASEKKSTDVAKLAGAELLTVVLPALLSGALASQAPKGRDKAKKWIVWGAGAIASQYLEMAPLLRDIPHAIQSKGHEFGDPFTDVLSSGIWATMDLIKHAEHSHRYSISEAKSLGMVAGYFMEAPSRQVMDSWAVAHDWATHRYHPDNAVSGLLHVATGKEPK